MSAPGALEPDEISRLLAPLAGEAGLLAACSGGPDSTALLIALARWRDRGAAPHIVAATVDHGLRPGSRAEAEAAGDVAKRLGFPHRLFVWEGPKPATGLQEAARDARYALLAAAAQAEGLACLVTAHHRGDQAETVLMRLCAGSGPQGLAGMRVRGEAAGLALVRPFLDVPKARLVATCEAAGLPFARDPANLDELFARGRLRAVKEVLAREGLSEARLARLAGRLAELDDAIAARAESVLAESRREQGLDARRIAAEPAAVAARVLALALRDMAGSPPRLERLEGLERALRGGVVEGVGLQRTLAGLLVRLGRDGVLTLAPAPERRRGKGSSGGDAAVGPASLGKGRGRA